MPTTLSRREFLKACGAAAAGLAIKPGLPPDEADEPRSGKLQPGSLGRAVYWLHYYQKPSPASHELGFYNADTVVRLYEEAEGEGMRGHNNIWYRTEDGWINSSYVQPVRRILQETVLEVPASGFLAEVTVPYTQAWLQTDQGRKHAYRFYYGSTYWVNYAYADKTDTVWYRVLDDLYKKKSYLVNGQHLRPIPAEELTPISPGVRDKRIEVDLTNQVVTAVETGVPVYSANTSTGYGGTATPFGEFTIERKQPSRHMASALESNGYDLPGVPWVCFIDWTGVSLHGTYWHNNFGRPQSHGCINLTHDDAKWFYRWTEPVVPPGIGYVGSDQGTRVVVY